MSVLERDERIVDSDTRRVGGLFSEPWLVVAILFGGIVRLLAATRVPLIFDEHQWIAVADRVSLWPLHLPLHGDAHPAASAWLMAAGASVLGSNVVGYRITSVLVGTALIWLCWRVGSQHFGRSVGLLAAAMVAGNEYLFGISRFATEKMLYLAMAVGAVACFLRAVETGRVRDYAIFGAFFGVGLMTKEALILWVPLLAWELVQRKGARALIGPGPLTAFVIMVLAILPDLFWNLFLQDPVISQRSDRGLMQHLQRLDLGWSFGPTSLFLRPAFQLVENGVSEYASMTSLPGGLLLAGALVSIRRAAQPNVRIWLKLGWGPFVFFTLFGASQNAAPEFWWSDLSVVPFALLTAAALVRVPVAVQACVLAMLLPGAINVALATENCYPSAAQVAGPLMERCRKKQSPLIAQFRSAQLETLTRFGPWRLQVADYYTGAATAYLAWLSRTADSTNAESSTWPALSPIARLQEIERMERFLQASGSPRDRAR